MKRSSSRDGRGEETAGSPEEAQGEKHSSGRIPSTVISLANTKQSLHRFSYKLHQMLFSIMNTAAFMHHTWMVFVLDCV